MSLIVKSNQSSILGYNWVFKKGPAKYKISDQISSLSEIYSNVVMVMVLRSTITLILSCFITSMLAAQQKAVTEMGEEVILFDDGTWKYQHEKDSSEDSIPTNPTPFEKDDQATFLLKSKNLNAGFWLDPKVWTFKKATNNKSAEYELKMNDADLYGMIITEKVEIPLQALRSIAIKNGQAAAPDLVVVDEEYRTVNGLRVLHLQMDGTTQGIKFSYYGYYFSNENGTIQYLTYTSQNLLSSYREACKRLLNGLVEMN